MSAPADGPVPSARSVKRRRPNIYDVAAAAGVSHMTASRVLNGASSIRESTRERVLDAMRELGYLPNSAARSLATDRTMRIGAIVDTPNEHGPGSTVAALEKAARKYGYAILPYSYHSDADDQARVGVLELLRHGVDAICVVGPRLSTPPVMSGMGIDVPVMVIGDSDDPRHLTADFDQYRGAADAVAHLLSLGHRRILHLAGPLDSGAGAVRHAAWERAMTNAGIEPLPCAVGDWSSRSGYAVGADREVVGGATAIFVANDKMALGVIHGLVSRGLRVPADVSVVGFDDMDGAEHFAPPLTTVASDFDVLGDAAMSALVRAIRGEPVSSVIVPLALVVRASARAVA